MRLFRGFDPLSIFAGVVVLLLCLPVHEFAHAYVADKLGDRTPESQGRLTLNPFAHIDPMGALFIIMFGFGWAKPVHVNPANFNRKRSMRASMAMVAAAGPLSNLLMSLLLMIIYKILLYSPLYLTSSGAVIVTVLYLMIIINISLGVFNLLPIGPLDGAEILSFFLKPQTAYKLRQYERQFYILLLVLMVTGALSVPIVFLRNHIFNLFNLLTLPIDLLLRGGF